MDRRDLLQLLTSTTAIAFLPPDLLPAGQALHRRAAGPARRVLTGRADALVTALGDLILPRTDSPSASDVRAAGFVDLLLAEWYPDEETARFLAGLAALDDQALAEQGARFAALDAAGQARLATALDGSTGALDTAAGAFNRVKGLVIYAWMSSPEVQQQVLHSPIIPGRFDGCVPLPHH